MLPHFSCSVQRDTSACFVISLCCKATPLVSQCATRLEWLWQMEYNSPSSLPPRSISQLLQGVSERSHKSTVMLKSCKPHCHLKGNGAQSDILFFLHSFILSLKFVEKRVMQRLFLLILPRILDSRLFSGFEWTQDLLRSCSNQNPQIQFTPN